MEVWKTIIGIELYEISNMGRIRNSENFRILSQNKSSGGGWYYNCSMTYKGKGYCKDIHRLVAENFVDRIDGKNYVNHIDNNPTNNNHNNLEWCTQKENIQHAVKQGRMKPMNGSIAGAEINRRKVNQYSLNGELIKTHNSLTSASNFVNRSITCICECCSGKQKTSAGFRWEYV